MPENKRSGRSSGKYYINLLLFILSVMAVLAIWPSGKRDSWIELSGSIIIITSSYLLLYLFLSQFRPEILEVTRKTFFIILTILVFLVLTRIVAYSSDGEYLYLIPFAVIPVLIRIFFDSRLALFILLITLMLAGFIVPEPFEFVFISFISGVIAIFSLTNIYRRARLLFSSVVIVISYSVIHFGLTVMNGNGTADIRPVDYILFLGNGVLILLSYQLIFLFEKNFYFLSESTLLELSDINHPLLRRFAEEAPGSFQHSLQVANLAEEAARVAGANHLLARAGSLYHDIGKIINPGYFIENQQPGLNPHDDMDPVRSSRIIINHVNEGVKLARIYKLPVQIIDFIRTHHGTTRAYFFYRKYLEKRQKPEESENEFVYPGPKPFSRETAIVMMADSVEAASRTLDKYTRYNINELVERIFIIQEHDEQYSEAPLTFRDLSDIKSIFKKRLMNIYHSRIGYPERDQGQG
jgi:cyclic-di-AMP phosphodiesterase PgpH